MLHYQCTTSASSSSAEVDSVGEDTGSNTVVGCLCGDAILARNLAGNRRENNPWDKEKMDAVSPSHFKPHVAIWHQTLV